MERTDREQLRVGLVDDHEVILHGVREYLCHQADLTVVLEALSAEDALDRMEEARPDVVIIDVRLPDMDGVSLCREIRNRYPSIRCLMFSSFSDESAMLEAVVAGASGFLLKDAELDELVEAVRDIGRGLSLIDPAMIERVLARLRHDTESSDDQRLTPQEQKILDLMAEGLSNREIAAKLFLAEQTVKNYVSSVLSKLGLRRRTQAALYAAEQRNRRAVE